MGQFLIGCVPTRFASDKIVLSSFDWVSERNVRVFVTLRVIPVDEYWYSCERGPPILPLSACAWHSSVIFHLERNEVTYNMER